MTPAQQWSAGLIVGALLCVAGVETGRDLASAQSRKPVFVTRMYTAVSIDGLSKDQ